MSRLDKLRKHSRKKKPSEKKRISRLIFILNKLSERERVTTSSLAEEFGVTKRTIQRDMMLLQDLKFPIYTDENAYIHKFVEGFSIRKISVTREEKFLLTLLYRLFSKVGQPFDTTVKRLLDKVLLSPNSFDKAVDDETEKIVEKEFRSFSKSLVEKINKPRYSQPFIEKIDEYLLDMRTKLDKLERRKKVGIWYKITSKYEDGEGFVLIRVPKEYFKDDINKSEYFKNVGVGVCPFIIKTLLPNTDNKIFRMVLYLTLFINSRDGHHIDEKNITCFDSFAEYMGFPKESRDFSFKYRRGDGISLKAIGKISWTKEIPMTPEDLKPYLDKNQK